MAGKRPKVNKPRRKHVGWGSALESEAGKEFVRLLHDFTGYFDVIPLARVGAVNVFAASGDDGVVLVLETDGVQTLENMWTTRLAFRTWSDPHIQVVLTMRRWDPWLEFDGDVVRSASRKQRDEWNDERARRAKHSDEMTSQRLATGDLLGLTSDELDECWERAFSGDLPERPLLDVLKQERAQRLRKASLASWKDGAGVSCDVDVVLEDNGEICISGEEYGRGATAIGSGYEFWWTIPESTRSAFLKHIGIDPRDPVKGIVAEFSGEEGWLRLRDLLEENARDFQIGFSSWMSTDFD